MRASTHALGFLLSIGAMLGGCGGSDFVPAAGSGGSDASVDQTAGGSGGSGGSSGPDGQAGGTDGEPGESSPPQDAPITPDALPQDVVVPSDGPTSCSTLPAGATDVYVDKLFQGSTQTGAHDCPFATIEAATNVPGTQGVKRTIHVEGTVPGVVYSEATRVIVGSDITLKRDGANTVTILAQGDCAALTCAVHVQSKGTLDGFTVTSQNGAGVVTANPSQPSEAPIVKNVIATLNGGSGIHTLGSAELGPGIEATHNAKEGLEAHKGTIHVLHSGVANDFSFNAANGVNVLDGATLVFDGGTAHNNGYNGIRLDQKVAPPPAMHEIHYLTAGTNNTGVAVFAGSLTLRTSKLLLNKYDGLSFIYAAGNVLDIGVTGDPGGNIFGTSVLAGNNTKAGVFLCASLGASTLPAEGDVWSICPPKQTQIADCTAQPPEYADVAYVPGATAGNPAVAANCDAKP